MSERSTAREQDRVGAVLFGFLALAHAAGRWWANHVPGDLGGYLAAAQAHWTHGWSPYDVAALEQLPIYQGYPFLYLPGTLPLLWPIDALGSTAALALDAILRVLALAWCARWLTRRFDLPIEWPQLGLLCAMFAPLGETFLHGNIASYMFALFGVTELAARRGVGGARGLGLGLGLGLLLMLKPMWGVPCGFVAIAYRRVGLTAGLMWGACVVGGASVAQAELFEGWRAMVEDATSFWRSFDLSLVGVWAQVAGATAWAGFGAWICARRRHHELAWLWACTSLLVWPRISTYSYALVLPLVCALWSRSGWKAALVVALPALGPIPWIVGEVDALARLVMFYAWAVGMTGWLAHALVRDDSGRSVSESLPLSGNPDTDRTSDLEATS